MKKTIRKMKFYPKIGEIHAPFRNQRRVAVYASSDEQLSSIEARKDYYMKYVEDHSDLCFVKLYANEGITGTSQIRERNFKMMADAKTGVFDLIITKSISRFARNTVDSLTCIRGISHYSVDITY